MLNDEKKLQSFQFLGIGMHDYRKMVFELVFELNGSKYLLTNIVLKKEEGISWSLKNSDVYHYTIPGIESTCSYCSYAYESGRKIADNLICKKLNQDDYKRFFWIEAMKHNEFKHVMTSLLEKVRDEMTKK